MPLSASAMINKDEVARPARRGDRAPARGAAGRPLAAQGARGVPARVRHEGDEILEQARARAERMVQRTEVVKAAEQRAHQIVETAEAEARRLRHEGEDFCDQKLASFEIVLERTLKLVAAGRAKLQGTNLLGEAERRRGRADPADVPPPPDEDLPPARRRGVRRRLPPTRTSVVDAGRRVTAASAARRWASPSCCGDPGTRRAVSDSTSTLDGLAHRRPPRSCPATPSRRRPRARVVSSGGIVATGTVTRAVDGRVPPLPRAGRRAMPRPRCRRSSSPTRPRARPTRSAATQIDLEPMVRDAVLLALPLAPLCADDCPGPAPDAVPDRSEPTASRRRRRARTARTTPAGRPSTSCRFDRSGSSPLDWPVRRPASLHRSACVGTAARRRSTAVSHRPRGTRTAWPSPRRRPRRRRAAAAGPRPGAQGARRAAPAPAAAPPSCPTSCAATAAGTTAARPSTSTEPDPCTSVTEASMLPVAVDAMGGDQAPARSSPAPCRPPTSSASRSCSSAGPTSSATPAASRSSRRPRSSPWTPTPARASAA